MSGEHTPEPAGAVHTPLTPESVASQIAFVFNMLGTGDPRTEEKAASLVRKIVSQTESLNLMALKRANELKRRVQDNHARLVAALEASLHVMETLAKGHGYDTSIGVVPQARAALAAAKGDAP